MKQRYIAVIGQVSIIAILADCATSNSGTIAGVAETLKVPSTQVLSFSARATGVQIYECKVIKSDPIRFEWVFKAPEAELFDSAGKRIGRHYAGQTWAANYGSKVVGEVRAREDGPAPNAIPWLLKDF